MIGAYCTSLKHLSVHSRTLMEDGISTLHPVLLSCGPTLEVLEIDVMSLSKADIDNIATHCRRLRRLKMRQQWCSDFHLSMESVWRALGSHLTDLEIECPDGLQFSPPEMDVSDDDISSLDLRVLAEECGNISRLALIHFPQSMHAEIVRLCEQLGERLQFLLTDARDENDFCAKDVEKICKACPKARMDMRMGEVNADCMEMMGSQAVSFEVTPQIAGGVPHEDVFTRVNNACTELTTVRVFSDDVRAPTFRTLFATQKPRLVKVCVDLLHGTGDVAIFRVLAERVSTIEEFVYAGPPPPVKCLPAFVEANQELRTVDFKVRGDDVLCSCQYEEDDDDAPVIDWGKIMAPFWRSGKLRELRCGCERHTYKAVPEWRDLALPVYSRRILVSLCGRRIR